MTRAAEQHLVAVERPLTLRARIRAFIAWPGWSWRGWHWVALLAILILGTGLRVWHLDRPAIWGDEAATYGRVCGTNGEMAMAIRQTAFGPLHYEMLWWVGQGMPIWPPGNITWPQVEWKQERPDRYRSTVRWDERPPLRIANYVPTRAERNATTPSDDPHQRAAARAIFPNWTVALTPAVLRAVPTVAGILSILSMYYLARQVVRRQTALVVALFTACSAWMLAYSRDAKMYADLWFFASLSTALLMHWTRSLRGRAGFFAGRRLLWWAWVAAGTAMVGVHALGLMILAVQVLIFLVAPRPHWLRGIAFAIGVLIMLIGPAKYYLETSRMARVANPEQFDDLGIDWVEVRNKGKEGWELANDSLSAMLLGWHWINEPFNRPWVEDKVERVSPPVNAAVAPWIKRGMWAIACLAILGLLPWRRMLICSTGFQPVIMGWKPMPRKSGVVPPHSIPWWRSCLWIGLFLVLPMYGIYWASFKAEDVLTPWQIVRWLRELTSAWVSAFLEMRGTGFKALLGSIGRWSIIVAAAAVVAAAIVRAFWTAGRTWPQRLSRTGALVAVIFGVALLCHLMGASDERPVPKSVWMPRWMGIIWPALAIGLCTLLMRLPTWPLRTLAITFLIGANLTQFVARVREDTEPPIDLIAADLIAYRADARTPVPIRAYTPIMLTTPGCPGGGSIVNHIGSYYAVIQSGSAVSPESFRGGPHPVVAERPIDPQSVIGDLKRRRTQLSTAIVWVIDDMEREAQKRAGTGDRYLAALGDGWKLAGERRYKVRIVWSWSNLYTLVRREYVRTPATTAPATAPTTVPATRPATTLAAPATTPATQPATTRTK